MVDARARVGGGAQQQQVQPFVALLCSRPVCFGCSLSCGWVDTCGRNLRVFLHSCNMYFFVICRRISSLQIPTLCRWQPVCSSCWWWAETSASACHAPQILGIWICREWTHMNTETKQKTNQIKNKYLDRKHMCTLYWGARICVFWKPSIFWLHQH